jgi:uncharacterized protein YbaP (TraB family)
MNKSVMKFSPLILSILFVFITQFSFSQNTLLFKISGKDLKQPSYAFGTMHVNDEKAFNFGDAVFDAIEACDVAAFEIDMSKTNSNELREQIQEDTVFTNLLDYIKLELPKKLDSTFKKEAFAMKLMTTLPLFRSKLNGMESAEGARTQHIDAFLESFAMHNGKTIHGIESLPEQLHILLDFDKEVIVQGIADFLMRPDWDSLVLAYFDNTEKLKKQYTSLKLDSVCTEFYQANYSVEFIEKLLDKRNVNMVDRTLPIMKTKPVFIAVGAGHLCGNKGILAILKEKGYTITPIDITTKNVQPVTFTWIKNDLTEVGINVETANVRFTNEKYNKQYIASDTTRKGLIHFELRNDYDKDLIKIETWDDESNYSDGYEEDIEIEEIEEANDEVEGAVEIELDGETDVMYEEGDETYYGDDHIGDTEIDDEVDAPMEQEVNTEFINNMRSSLAKFNIEEKVDTLYIDGKVGKIEVLKKNLAGRITYKAKIHSLKEDEKIWILTISGDPLLLNNEAIMRYFTSFEFIKP